MAEKQEETAAQLAEATLTDEWVSEWEQRIGLELRVANMFNQNASYEAIRNFSNGIGDSNPLYRDEEYAKGTRYGALSLLPVGWRVCFRIGSCKVSQGFMPTTQHRIGSS